MQDICLDSCRSARRNIAKAIARLEDIESRVDEIEELAKSAEAEYEYLMFGYDLNDLYVGNPEPWDWEESDLQDNPIVQYICRLGDGDTCPSDCVYSPGGDIVFPNFFKHANWFDLEFCIDIDNAGQG